MSWVETFEKFAMARMQQVKITFLSTSLFAFINQKLSANFPPVPLGLLFLQSMQHLQ